MIRILVLSFAGLLTGCAALGGGADYRYSHIDENGASCEIVVGSTRSLAGVAITIDDRCQLTADAQKADANLQLLRVLGKALDKVPSVPVGGP